MVRVPKNRRPSTPGEILEEDYLKAWGMDVLSFALHIKMKPSIINEVIDGERRMTPNLAVCFGMACGTTPEFWLNLQHAVDLYDVKDGNTTAVDIKPIR